MKGKISKNTSLFLGIASIYLLFLYRNWFFPGLIAAGDFWPTDPRVFSEYSLLPYVWNNALNNGFGGNPTILLWNYFFFQAPILFWGVFLHLPYEIVERVGYLLPLLILSLISSFYWSKYFFSSTLSRLLSAFLYVSNTYILMVIDGGQLGIAYSYLFAPLVFLGFMRLYTLLTDNKINTIVFIKQSIICGTLLAIQINFDLRISYITGICVILYLFGQLFFERFSQDMGKLIKKMFLYAIIIPGICVYILHAFWILPLLLKGVDTSIQAVGSDYTGIKAADFFSFGTFSQSLSLLHPNWPENIFGKVYFMRFEFLLIPLMAFSFLFFISKKKDKRKEEICLVILASIALVGVFLGKGANEPLQSIYFGMFEHIPGFVMFREPTKFYLLIALTYSVLIPWTMEKLTNLFKNNHVLITIFYGIVFGYFAYLIYPAFSGVVDGTLQSTEITPEYKQFSSYIFEDKSFSRILWLPEQHRFGVKSNLHPAVNSTSFFGTTKLNELVDILEEKNKKYPNIEKLLQNKSIKYVVVPIDTDNEFFTNDRQYTASIRENLIERLDRIPWLTKVESFQSLRVYTIPKERGLFWNSQNIYTWKMNSPVSYSLNVTSDNKKQIIFSQSFDSQWVAEKNNHIIHAQKSKDDFNQFILPSLGRYIIYNKGQEVITIATSISLLGGISIFIFLLIPQKFYKRFL